MTVDLLLKGGTIVTPAGMNEAALAIDGEQIVAVGDTEQLPSAEQTIDVSGQLLMPGVVDPHVHIGDYISEDTYETATKAAALGGVTTIIDFAWQGHVGQDNPWEDDGTLAEGIRTKRDAADGEAIVDHTLHAGILREDEHVLDEIPDIVDSGISSFKIFTAYDWGLSNGFMRRVMETLAETGAVGLYHTEDQTICEALTTDMRAAGLSAATDYPDSRPDYAEAIAADAAARLAVETGSKYYGVHTSCQAAAEVLDRYQHEGQIRAETCTHYTALNDSVYADLGDLPRIAPPIRPKDDVEAIFEYLRRGTLSVVSTDHVAQSAQAKSDSEWWEGPYGANGLQVSLPVFHHQAVVERDFSYPFLVRTMATNPAATFGLEDKGTLEPGTDADIVVFDPSSREEIDAANNASVADHSIYQGMEVEGAVTKTFVRGTLVADDRTVTASPGHGEFIERDVPNWNE